MRPRPCERRISVVECGVKSGRYSINSYGALRRGRRRIASGSGAPGVVGVAGGEYGVVGGAKARFRRRGEKEGIGDA